MEYTSRSQWIRNQMDDFLDESNNENCIRLELYSSEAKRLSRHYPVKVEITSQSSVNKKRIKCIITKK